MGFLIAYLLGVLTAVERKKDNGKHSGADTKKDCPALPITVPVPNVPVAPSDQERANQQKKDCREKWKFRFEVLGIFVLCVYAGFTIAIWYANRKAANAADETVKQVQEQIRLSVRPWIGIADQQDAFTADHFGFSTDGVANVWYAVTMKNFGNVPAQNVNAYAQLVVSVDFDRINREQEKACSANSIGHPGGYIIFSGKESIYNKRISFWLPGDIVLDKITHKTTAIFVGCIGYRDQFGCLYRTRFAYQLRAPEQSGVPVFFEPKNGTEIPGNWVPHYSGSAIDAGDCPKK
jgi:hypothetical protein